MLLLMLMEASDDCREFAKEETDLYSIFKHLKSCGMEVQQNERGPLSGC